MTKPQLYWTQRSPPSRAVLMTAKLLNVDMDLVQTNLLVGDQLKPEFVKMNPQHTIPLLVDDGAIIYDSHAICAYLVGKYGKNDSLYPTDLVHRAQVDARLHFDTGYLFGRLRPVIEPIIYFGHNELDPVKMKYAELAYPMLEAFLSDSKYLCGDRLTIADVCCEATLCSANLLLPIDADKYPKLTAWRQVLSKELPDYERDCAEGGRLLQEFVLSKLKTTG